jgi:hypothetical protein
MTATRPRFADPTTCPDCRSLLPVAPFRCPSCALPLQGFLASELLRTLGEADDLLGRLRASAVAPTAAAAAPPREPLPPLDPDLPPMPALPVAGRPQRHGLRGASVPKILLGLGATCLLVAAVIFLAVAWSWLGVGGRTVVLVALTATTGTLGTVLGRRGLRVAAEALTTVALGLLVLDVLGADEAGWFGTLALEELARLVGAAVLVAGLALSVSRERLVVPQLVAPAGMALVLASIDWTSYAVGAVDVAGLAGVFVFAAMVVLAVRLGAVVLRWVAGLCAAAVWAVAGLWALSEAVAHPTAHELWVDGHGWELVVASLLTLLAWGAGWQDSIVREGAATVVVSALTFVAVLPLLDGSQTQVTFVALLVTVGWTGIAAVTPTGWYVVPRVPLLAGALVATASALTLAATAIANIVAIGAPFTEPAAVRLLDPDVSVHPLLLLATAVALAAAALLATPRTHWTVPASAATVALAGLLTLGLYPLPLWVVLAALAAIAGGLLALALRRESLASAIAAAVAVTLLVVAALPSVVLTTVSLGLVVGALILVLLMPRFTFASEAAGLALPAAIGGLIWTTAELVGLEQELRAAPVLLVLGLLAIGLPRPQVEAAAAASGLIVSLAALETATDGSMWLAVHLTLAGALVTTSAIVNPARRMLAWPGGALLAGATWVRLWDVGVVEPEPYTLPTAAALIAVGLYRMRTATDAPTAPTIGPGLALATVPSLLWVLADPVSLRAGVLGLACLLMLLAGVQLRWHAPVVVGSVVGGVVVLRELAPYALETPQWVVIGLAGTVLVACGITWESRMRDLQQAATYLGRLR